MRKKAKIALLLVSVITVSALLCACGPVEKEEPDVPTNYIEKADDAVDEYNENVQKLNQTGNTVDNTTQEQN